jgi:hypothetical protein
VIRESIRMLAAVTKVLNFLKMVVHRRRYIKIRLEIKRLEAEQKSKMEMTRETVEAMDMTYRSTVGDTSTYRRRQVTKKEAVIMLEKAWIRYR